MSATLTQINTIRDASGFITVSLFSRIGNPPQQHWIDEEILVPDPDMIAIGGGGIGNDSPGALLTASYPNSNLSGWVVSSKDHEVQDFHQLQTFVLGMKIAGMSKQQLLDSVIITQANSAVEPHPEAEAGIPSDEYVLVGGGFRVDWHGMGNLGTASFPSTASSWKARSKDHDLPDPSSIRAYAIGIKRFLPSGRIRGTNSSNTSSIAPHPEAVATLEPGFALVGGGAEVHYHIGNLLWKLEPSLSPESFIAASKDHMDPDPSSITAYALGILLERE
jgi:hypothetical protein